MHELSCTEGLIRTSVRAAEEAGAKRILRIEVRCGRYSGILPDYVKEYFALASRGTMAEGAELIIEEPPCSISCRCCGFSGPLQGENANCPACGSPDIRLLDGFDVVVKSLTAE